MIWKGDDNMEMALIMDEDDEKEASKIREYLKQVDKKFYYRAIENRKKEGKKFFLIVVKTVSYLSILFNM